VTLAVTDNAGAVGRASVAITVSEPTNPGGAVVIGYTTLDASGGIPPTAPWGISDPEAPTGANAALELAASFVVTAEGRLHSVELPIARRQVAASSLTPRVFSLAADAGGQPGTVLEWWSIVPGLTMSMVELVSVERPALVAGAQYWLTAHINPTGTGADFWPSNGLGVKGPMLYRRSLSEALSPFTSVLPAFRVKVASGDSAPMTQGVPSDASSSFTPSDSVDGPPMPRREGFEIPE
jgi:hypothetical protein